MMYVYNLLPWLIYTLNRVVVSHFQSQTPLAPSDSTISSPNLLMCSRSSHCSTTGVTKAMLCAILSVVGAYKRTIAANRKE